jgi:hypothetical protein
MPRSRVVKPEFWDDEKLASGSSRDARLLFIGMWNQSDDYAVVKGHPTWLKNKIFPYEEIKASDFQRWLKELESLRCIIPFEADGEKYYYIRSFTKHQVINRPSAQRNPEPPENIFEDSRSTHVVLTDETETEVKPKPKPKENVNGADAPKTLHMRYVYLNEKELERMIDKIGKEQTDAYIERLDGYIGQIGPPAAAKKYKSHYDTMMNWYRKDLQEGKITQHQGLSDAPPDWRERLDKKHATR